MSGTAVFRAVRSSRRLSTTHIGATHAIPKVSGPGLHELVGPEDRVEQQCIWASDTCTVTVGPTRRAALPLVQVVYIEEDISVQITEQRSTWTTLTCGTVLTFVVMHWVGGTTPSSGGSDLANDCARRGATSRGLASARNGRRDDTPRRVCTRGYHTTHVDNNTVGGPRQSLEGV
eukprot:m.146616 g.146616  ORF g.146616 m.146616 type:complete len:175 (-) comp23120_c0_seq1:1138-1662(-)